MLFIPYQAIATYYLLRAEEERVEKEKDAKLMEEYDSTVRELVVLGLRIDTDSARRNRLRERARELAVEIDNRNLVV